MSSSTIFYTKIGGNWPSLTATLYDGNNEAISLETADKVLFFMRTKKGQLVVDGEECVILEDDGSNTGKVRYDWRAQDVSMNTTFEVEFKILWQDGKITKIPSRGYNEVIIGKGLED